MNKTGTNIHRYVLKIPIAGMLLFVLLYIISAYFYPGGSQASVDQVGFSWANNYLCDLLDNTAINGQPNIARGYARAALGFLCFSLILLWVYLPLLFKVRRRVHFLISFFGIASMLTTVFLASEIHDIIVRIAGALGVVAILLTFIQLYRSKYLKLLFFGLVCLIFMLTNYYIYETAILINWLPVIQKITFISWILWFVLLNVLLLRKTNH